MKLFDQPKLLGKIPRPIAAKILFNENVCVLAAIRDIPIFLVKIIWLVSLHENYREAEKLLINRLEIFLNNFSSSYDFSLSHDFPEIISIGLFNAFSKGDLDLVQLFMSSKSCCKFLNSFFSVTRATSNSPVHSDKQYESDVKALQIIFQKIPALVNFQNERFASDSPLHQAVKNHRVDILNLLISQPNINVFLQSRFGTSALENACGYRYLDCVEILLPYYKEQPDVIAQAFQRSIETDNLNLVNLMLLSNPGINVNFRNGMNRNSLHLAVNSSHTGILEVLLRNGADPRAVDMHGVNPFHIACSEGTIDVIRCLLTHSPDLINIVDNRGNTPLAFAALRRTRSISIIRMLLKYGAETNGLQATGIPPLHCAVNDGFDDACALLLENGANPNIRSHEENPIHAAARNNYLPIVKTLIAYGADPFVTNHHNSTPINISSEWGHLDVVKTLFEGLTNEEAWDIRNRAKELMDVDIPEDPYDPFSLTRRHPLYLEFIPKILPAGIIDVPDNDGDTPLINASRGRPRQNETPGVPEYLLSQGANIDLQNNKQETALFVAMNTNRFEQVITLLKHKADVKLQNENQLSPLNIAESRKFGEENQILKSLKGEVVDWNEINELELVAECSNTGKGNDINSLGDQDSDLDDEIINDDIDIDDEDEDDENDGNLGEWIEEEENDGEWDENEDGYYF
ncbi:B-cell lymphoma 3 protein [Nowakowskiella sp. JEL0078]|nr:B-cell lymphoma 3 protein [Nowakowskiella sp. JEL0078]